MKSIYLATNPYRDLPDDFRDRYESVWVTPPNQELCDPATAGRYLRSTLEELEYADAMGFDAIGTNEHHQNGFGFPVSPHMLAGIQAARDSDVAICILGTTLPLYPPLRVAEELATIDVISGGRLISGMPVGSPMDTVGVAGIPPTQVRERFYETHDFVKRAWTEPGPFAFNGRFTKQRYVNPWPQPLQDPHPPIWLAGGTSVETWRFAAEHDYAYCYLTLNGYKAGEAIMQGYREVLESHGIEDNPYRTGFAQIICVADTDAEAKRLYERHVLAFWEKALYIAPQHSTVPGFMSRSSLSRFMEKTGSGSPFASPLVDAGYDEIVESGAVIAGSPETCRQRLEECIRSLRIGHLVANMQLMSMGTELTKHNIRLFAEQVMPHLRTIWDDEGYVDHWWPARARGGQAAAATAAAVQVQA